MSQLTDQLQAFVDDVDNRRLTASPELPLQPVPKDLLYLARDHIFKYLRGVRVGGSKGRGHRWQNVPPSQLSQTPRAIRARQTRINKKKLEAGLPVTRKKPRKKR